MDHKPEKLKQLQALIAEDEAATSQLDMMNGDERAHVDLEVFQIKEAAPAVRVDTPLNVKQMTMSALERFVQAVDDVMEADDLCAAERRDLIGYWAYRYKERDMPAQLRAAIARCQKAEFVHPTASSVVSWVSGEVAAFSAAQYT